MVPKQRSIPGVSIPKGVGLAARFLMRTNLARLAGRVVIAVNPGFGAPPWFDSRQCCCGK